jgi:hypothetical protein
MAHIALHLRSILGVLGSALMKNKLNSSKGKPVFWVLLALVVTLSGCGGGGNPGSGNQPIDSGSSVSPVQTAPGGLYVGYFQEDPVANPEDPETGAFVLTLPEKDGTLSGSMNFTYMDCQSFNVSDVTGKKSGLTVGGTWAGFIDNSVQSGSYSGTYRVSNANYSGGYGNFNGKQFKNVAGCLPHYLAANGTCTTFAVEKNQPASFALTVQGASVSWQASTGSTTALVYLIDSVMALSGNGNSVVLQTLRYNDGTSYSFAGAGLSKGREYIVVVALSNGSSVLTAFGSKRFFAS